MAAQYSHLQFFRRVPNTLLASYFESRDAVLGVDFAALKEAEVEPILASFLDLAAEQQAEIEAEFQDVDALASEGGVGALVDEAGFHEDEAFVEALAAIDGFHGDVHRRKAREHHANGGGVVVAHARKQFHAAHLGQRGFGQPRRNPDPHRAGGELEQRVAARHIEPVEQRRQFGQCGFARHRL